MNIFDAGAIRQNIKVQTARQEQALIQYESAVLNAQLSLLSFQDELVQSDGAVTTNLVRLYKALGGGWQFYETENEKPMKTAKEKFRKE